MDLKNALSFCFELDNFNCTEVDSITYKTPDFGTCDPFGMLMIGAKIREFEKRNNHITYYYDPVDIPHSYSAHMGFYQSIGIPYGKEPGEASGSHTYKPISKLSIDIIKKTAQRRRVNVAEVVEDHAEALAKILYAGSTEAVEHMSFAIREIMRNVVEHSKSDTLWYAGQVWRSYDLVEIAILDDGIGIHDSLKANRYYAPHVNNNLEALKLALEPGITRTFMPNRRIREDYEDGWRNSGFGLYITSNICSNIGSFFMCSGDSAVERSKLKENFIPCSLQGTAIRMRLRLIDIPLVTDLRSKLLREGEVHALKNAKAIGKASKASGLSFMRDRTE